MSLGHVLLTKKLITQEQLDAAVVRQKLTGGRIEDHLVALGYLPQEQVEAICQHTGKKFDVPFDELVVFSTNLSPEDLMDAAFLRRIHYKLFIGPPSAEDYTALFHRVCALRGLELPQTVLSYIQNVFYATTQTRVAAFHPKFIVEHVVSSCVYAGMPPRFTEEMRKDALQNLLILDEDAEG